MTDELFNEMMDEYEEESFLIEEHVKRCTLYEQDVYCKICNEY